jgi:plasmid stability protein
MLLYRRPVPLAAQVLQVSRRHAHWHAPVGAGNCGRLQCLGPDRVTASLVTVRDCECEWRAAGGLLASADSAAILTDGTQAGRPPLPGAAGSAERQLAGSVVPQADLPVPGERLPVPGEGKSHASCMQMGYPCGMGTAVVQVRDLPEEVVATLKARAESRGQSLTAYLRDLLTQEAAMPPVEDVMAGIASREPVSYSMDDLRSFARDGRR